MRNVRLICFSDASFANLPDNGSQGAHIIFLMGDNDKHTPIVWKSTKLKRVVRSSLAAETLAMEEAVGASRLLRSFLLDAMSLPNDACPVHCIIDSKSLYDTLKSTKTVTEKRLKNDISLLRDLSERKEITSVEWRETQEQLADCLTKAGASSDKLLMVLDGSKCIYTNNSGSAAAGIVI